MKLPVLIAASQRGWLGADPGPELTMPSFIGAGTASASGDVAVDLTPGLPGDAIEGDKMILQVSVRQNATATCATPDGWDLLFDDIGDGAFPQWIFAKDHEGVGESAPAVNWGSSPATVGIARIYAYRDVAAGEDWFEGEAATDGSGDASVEMPSVATEGNERLAVAFTSYADDSAIGAADGETGGDWVESIAEAVSGIGSDIGLQAQHAEMPDGGTISGGVSTMGLSVGWRARAFALKPAES